MDELYRISLLKRAIHYWLPSGWSYKGSKYERLGNIDITGDIDSGGVDIYISKDGYAEVTVSFTNEECYDGYDYDGYKPTITPTYAKSRVYEETGV
jgi:hypothetical protein